MTAVETLGIAGSGLIAAGLAACAARSPGHRLWARSEASAARVQEAIARHCDRLGAQYRPENVTITTRLDDLSASTFVVEAIAEDMAAKTDLLALLQRNLRPDAILVSTTSSLCIRTLAAASGDPSRFAGLHVFNPVPKMRLVEVAFGQEAAPETRRRTIDLCLWLGKEPVQVPAIPGYVVNSLLFPYLFHAVEFMHRHSMAPEMVDACMQMGAAHPMGPIALLDYVGLDVAVAIGDALDLRVPSTVRDLVAGGALGRKTRRGLYPEDHYRPQPAAG
ncbi:3-hydroxyacyl-CoA dehydrogenase family protein [Brevundimonas halotolerans]|uniref:3-hydroxybutyryl-CoA dehydrogenase n=1 Tax=Brevundimonas halotolerans TaxID=69670 RepID=A0A7W9E8X3_9CAUL|nr:3-hydroxyacyl-CoA dehydrogenase family protein [Brevundimonas halotolerans]MBB5661419.1 3-hydroxybutyryl-CoA dehydrogenase [Brevundimonas halotolerans]